ncbi:tetratricopeptide repeat protein [Oceanobacter sp. 3_MG-2023]|uniref:tetratricopeptide repeat protein n=1 Tax=Oceanobacter sp. 3_MG-2023 TaxID=3062622 RepID=UPI0027357A4B|nr:tetratricopeptide repeat protein [Oceanobacter sp. 3_MG-2023]MDP2506330.1 tetratricopeptide repeat protein [Oceanobacter sp. 3_MG-2023]
MFTTSLTAAPNATSLLHSAGSKGASLSHWLLTTLAFGILLPGCASQQMQPDEPLASTPAITQSTEPEETAVAADEVEDERVANFSQTELVELLTAEFAGQRQQFERARDGYLASAKRTGNPQIAARATQVSQYMGAYPQAIQAANIWLAADPGNAEVHWQLAQLYMAQRQFVDALGHLQKLQALTGDSHYELLASTASLGAESDRRPLLDALSQALQEDLDNPSLWTAVGILEQGTGNDTSALEHFNQALVLDSANLPASVFKARMLAARSDKLAALAWVEQVLQQHPDHKGMQVLRARLLLNTDQILLARQAFSDLHQQYPGDHTVLLSLGLIEFDMGEDQSSYQHLVSLLESGAHQNQALFYLGQLSERLNQPDQALEYYIQVKDSREFMPAHLNAAALIAEQQGIQSAVAYLTTLRQSFPKRHTELTILEASLLTDYGQYQESMDRYTRLINDNPNDAKVIYYRALVAERMNNLPLMEQDLRRVIELQPDNADALNALGYTLVDRLHRIEDGLPLLQRALALRPNSPAIIDSLGWAYFKLGDYQKAEPLLQQAFTIIADHEIAAHYGELLWITGAQQQAKAVWQSGLQDQPDSTIIENTLQRLKVDLNDQ